MSNEEREETIEDANPYYEEKSPNVANHYRDGKGNDESDILLGIIFLIGEGIASYILIILIFVIGVNVFFLIIIILIYISIIGIVYIKLIVRFLDRDSQRNKESDFFKGFLLIIGLIVPYWPLTFIVMMFAYESVLLFLAIFIIFFITYIYIIIVLRRYIIKKNRRYIATGMIIPFLISIIIFVVILIFSILSELTGFVIYI